MSTPNHRRWFSEPIAPNQKGCPLPNCPYQLPFDPSITLTYALAVSAIRKRNPIAKSRRISDASPRISARCAARLFSLSGLFFLSCGYRELILSLARTPESRGYGTPLRGVRPSWLSGVLSVLPDGRRQRSEFVARLAMQTVRPALPNSPPRGTIAASASVTATFSRGHAYARTLRDGQPTIVRPLDIAMRKPPPPST